VFWFLQSIYLTPKYYQPIYPIAYYQAPTYPPVNPPFHPTTKQAYVASVV